MFSKFSKKSEKCRTGCYLNAYELLQLNLEDITRELITYNEIQVYHKEKSETTDEFIKLSRRI